jgi:hypothetical protein
VRGDLAYAQEIEIAPDSTFSSPSVLNTYSVGAGSGYKVNDWFRTDPFSITAPRSRRLESARRHKASRPLTPREMSPRTDICTSHLDTEIHRWDLLANGYVDLGTWDGFTILEPEPA